MRCPHQHCNSPDTTNIGSHYDGSPNRPLPQALQGLNIVRRRRRCLTCTRIFFTIEMLENDFNELKRPPGRLESQNVRIRP